ncbi:MAG: carboxypeptidase regulatory-like domain-containing protein [Bryobacterales bacterium]|nr:carboxypeptidase regulatory-like domain-containing protein [Bryobacterales bacterium]
MLRSGQPLEVEIRSRQQDLGGALAIEFGGRTRVTRAVRLEKGMAAVTVPYDPAFQGEGVVRFLSSTGVAVRKILYPSNTTLQVSVQPDKATYRPGETAALTLLARDGSGPVEAAFGIAVADDAMFLVGGRDRNRVAAGSFVNAFMATSVRVDPPKELEVAGLTAAALKRIDPARIDGDLSLVAEALYPSEQEGPTYSSQVVLLYGKAAHQGLARVIQRLDDHFVRHGNYPRDEEALSRIVDPHSSGRLASGMLDPWMHEYMVRFSTEGAYDSTEFLSAGPDKRFGTDDDFVAASVSREWFHAHAAVMRHALEATPDYPATPAEFVSKLKQAGLDFGVLRDRSGEPLRVTVDQGGPRRNIQIWSNGADRLPRTGDDFVVTGFSGSYAGNLIRGMTRALEGASDYPETAAQLQNLLSSAKVFPAREVDPWGKPYRTEIETQTGAISVPTFYTYAQYGGAPERRQGSHQVQRIAVKVKLVSNGPDRVPGTGDDIVLTSIRRQTDKALRTSVRPVERGRLMPGIAAGRIAGEVRDVAGGAIQGAEVWVGDLLYTHTDASGQFAVPDIAEGRHSVTLSAPGFQRHVVAGVPVHKDQVTRVDSRLETAPLSQTMDVEEPAPKMYLGGDGDPDEDTDEDTYEDLEGTYTPRVPDYFPDTLYWAPEVVSGAEGRAVVKFEVPAANGAFRVTVSGATADGRLAETRSRISIVQPFLATFDLPAILTAGDTIEIPVQVRNDLDRSQQVTLEVGATPALEASTAPLLVPASGRSETVVRLRAAAAEPSGELKVAAKSASHAYQAVRPFTIHPDGEPVTQSISGQLTPAAPMRVELDKNAMAGTLRAELHLDPTPLEKVFDALDGMLKLPAGDTAETILSSYSNLSVLRTLRESSVSHAGLELRAREFLTSGYSRLLTFQSSHGGFRGGRGAFSQGPNVPLTVKAVTFLREARAFVTVDDRVLRNAIGWLARQEAKPGERGGLTLLALEEATRKPYGTTVTDWKDLAGRTGVDDPYGQAVLALAAIQAKDREIASQAVNRLRALAKTGYGQAYWPTPAAIPAGRDEPNGPGLATALAVKSLRRWKKWTGGDDSLSELIDQGFRYLMVGRSERHHWSQDPVTLLTLEALLEELHPGGDSAAGTVQIFVNGQPAAAIPISGQPEKRNSKPIDLTHLLRTGQTNEITVKSPPGWAGVSAKVTAHWYRPWQSPAAADGFSVSYSATSTVLHQPVRCNVKVPATVSGTTIVEVGLPPGAQLDDAAIREMMSDDGSGMQSYQLHPDRVEFILNASGKTEEFSFTFRPRYRMRAKSGYSVAYSNWNHEKRTVLPSTLFVVK